MAVAKLYPEPERLKRSGSVKNTDLKPADAYVSHARTVLKWLPEIADLVMAGTKPLNDAYQEAQRLKEQADAEPKRAGLSRPRVSALLGSPCASSFSSLDVAQCPCLVQNQVDLLPPQRPAAIRLEARQEVAFRLILRPQSASSSSA